MKNHALLVLSILVMLIPVSVSETSPTTMVGYRYLSGYVPHGSISITGNDDFANQASSEGWPGSGSASNPYVIENYAIQGPSWCIWVSQVSVSFLVRQCALLTTSYFDCVILSSTSNGCIEDCVVQSGHIGVGFYNVNNCILDSNRIEGSRDVVLLKESYNCTLSNNILTNGGVLLDSMDATSFQHTFFNNTVMGRPLGYFSGVSSQNIDASSFGQLIVVNCSFLAISGGNLSGIPYGVLLVACQDCDLWSCIASNSEYGVVVLTCDKVMVGASEFFGDIYCGVVINRSSNCILTSNYVHSNSNGGIMILGPNATITDNSIYQNGVGIALVEGWGGVQTIGGLVSGNSIRENSGYGIELGNGVSGYQLFSNVFDSNGVDARDDGSGNSWDNGVDTGNQWSNYSGYGVYHIPGSAGSVDHYPRLTYANTTNGIIDGLLVSDLALVVWLSLSIAVVATPLYLVIRTRRS